MTVNLLLFSCVNLVSWDESVLIKKVPGDIIYLSIIDPLNFYRNCLCACLCLSPSLVLPQAALCKDCFLRQRDRALAFCCSRSTLCHLCSRRISFFILHSPAKILYPLLVGSRCDPNEEIPDFGSHCEPKVRVSHSFGSRCEPKTGDLTSGSRCEPRE